jgi:hypothetical protein
LQEFPSFTILECIIPLEIDFLDEGIIIDAPTTEILINHQPFLELNELPESNLIFFASFEEITIDESNHIPWE